MKMNRFLFLFLLLGVMMVSCNNAKTKLTPLVAASGSQQEEAYDEELDTLELFEPEVLPESADQLFNDFFYNFASDMQFQKQRIVFPVKCEDCDTIIKCKRADWTDQLVVDDYYVILYERPEEVAMQQDTSIANVTVERINLDINEVDFFRFDRINGKWMMTGVRHEPIPETTNSDFLQFYHAFSSDSTTLRNSILEPLKFVLTSEDEEIEDEVQELSVDEWLSVSGEIPFPSHQIVNINYGQTCISRNNKLLLVTGISNGLFMRYKFTKIDGQWMLVEVVV